MSWAAPNAIVSKGFVVRDDEDEYDLKMQFAAIVAKDTSQALKAGYKLFKGVDNYGRAMQAQAWLTDPDVVAEIARLTGEDAASLLPTNDEIELKTWQVVQAAVDPKVQLQGLELLTKLRGMQKGTGDGGGNTTLIQNVIKLPNRVEGPDEEELFRARFEAQQLKLVRDARSPRSD